MQEISSRLKKENISIGFVPTMGALHEGHLSLVKESKKENDITIVSIFVNPAQFAPSEDYTKYPRDTEKDARLLHSEGVDYIFIPPVAEIYPADFKTYIEVTDITKKQEGEFRPDHFKGVTTIVAILFNIIQPSSAYFGQKDAQQSAVIKRMVDDLKYDIAVRVCPIVRENDGLAMSSRNIYLTEEERKKALILSASLKQAEEIINKEEREASVIIKMINRNFLAEKSIQLNYIRIVEADSFKEAEKLLSGKEYFILIACKIGKTRLIDNILISV
jgi:pantoate--beta-alanine ligase